MDKTPQDRESKVAMILKYFGVIMAIFYFTMAVAIVIMPMFASIDTTIRYIFAAMLFLYGAFRLYRLIKS
ncbi:MAG: hypothetical protein V4590_04355 [Bacteroidota bacterium]